MQLLTSLYGKIILERQRCTNNVAFFSGQKHSTQCSCPKRLAYGTIDSLIGKLRSIFCLYGRGSDDSPIPGYGNPAASKVVKDYLSMVREEQLRARISPTQAQPFFIADLLALSAYIAKRLIDSIFRQRSFIRLQEIRPTLRLYFLRGIEREILGE